MKTLHSKLSHLFIGIIFLIIFSGLSHSQFIENVGQIINSSGNQVNEIKCYYQNPSGTIYFMNDRISFVRAEEQTNNPKQTINSEKCAVIPKDFVSLRMDFYLNSVPSDLVLSDQAQLTTNIYKNGSFENIIIFNSLIYKSIKPNIDLIFFFDNQQLKHKFINNSTDNLPKFDFEIEGLTINSNTESNLKLKSKLFNFLIKNLKNSTEKIDPINDYISSLFSNLSLEEDFGLNNDLSKKSNDVQQEIIISKELHWSTFVGGSNIEIMRRMTLNAKEEIIFAGHSYSPNFPITPGLIQDKIVGDMDFVFVKFDQNGNKIWSTIYGGSGGDYILQVLCNKDRIYFVGETRSGNINVSPNASQNIYAGGTADSFFGILTDDGKFVYSTFFGGSEYEAFCDEVYDSYGNIWVAGRTWSSNFPTTTNGYKTYISGHYDGTLVGFDKDGKLFYSSFWGGDGNEFAEGIAINLSNEIIISGYSDSDNYPVSVKSYQKSNNGMYDAFIVKFNSNLQPIWSTLYGGSANDYGGNVTIDKDNNIILQGITGSKDLNTFIGVFQEKLKGSSDLFIAKFTLRGEYEWGTYLGGSGSEGDNDNIGDQNGTVLTDDAGNIITGLWTTSSDLPTDDKSFQKKYQTDKDGFIFICDKDNQKKWMTYIGSTLDDILYSISLNKKGDLIVAGITKSSDFPVLNAFQPKLAGDWDGFIMKFGVSEPCINKPFSYSNFLNSKFLKYTGIARKSDSAIKLTDNRQYVAGAAWFDGLIPIDKGFSTKFAFRFTQGNNYNCQDGSLPGADGIAFLIQNAGVTAIGYPGGGLGYENIPNSLAIEYDTFSNDSTQIENYFDPNGNHVAVQSLGSTANSPKHTKTGNIAMNSAIFPIRSDGTVYYSQIDYSTKNKTLTVYLDSNKTLTNRVIYIENFDVSKYVSLVGGTKAVLGFTSATGCATQTHEILSWDICLETSEPATDVEENPDTEPSIIVSPNPFNDFIKVQLDNVINNVTEIQLIDFLGRVIENRTGTSDNQIYFNTSKLQSGVYFVRILTSGHIFNEKIIKYQ